MLNHKHIIINWNFLVKVLSIVFVFSFNNSWGQAVISTTGTAVVENFSTYLGTSVAPTNWTMSYTGGTNFNGTSQTTGSTGGWYGNSNMSFLGSGSASNGNATWTLRNTSCFTITSFTISFKATMWKSGTSSPNCTLSYSTNSTGTVPVAGALTNIGTFNDATPSIASGTILSYTVSPIAIVNNDYIFIRFINAGGSNGDNIGWDDVSITVDGLYTCCTAPTTTISPTTQTLCAGTATTINVSSSATMPSYTWQASANGSSGWANVANGTPAGASYSGTNSAALTVTAGTTYYYQCLVTENGTCTATSSTSTLVVNTNPTITTQPVNKTICSGSNTSFTVAASGSPLTYQWQEKIGAGAFANITNGGVYSGATLATLVLTNPGSGMSTNQYQCIVSVASCSSATSTAVVLTVNTTPAAPPAPSPASNPACTTGTLSAASSTVAGVTWYWQGTSSTSSVTTQSTASSYTLSSSGNYYVRALDASGTCWSSTSSVSVTVNNPVSAITAQPTNKSVCTGNNTTMDITGGSGSGSTKQWQFSTDNGATFSNVIADAVNSGVTLASLSLTSPPLSYNGYVYQCVITVPGCAVTTSSTGTLTVIQTPSAPPTPTALANPACSSTSLSVMTSTVAGVTWYWQGTTAAGSSSTSPTSSAYGVSTTGTYYVRARTDGSSCLSALSSSIAVTINTPPAITTNPTDKTQCVGTNTTFAVSATGSGLSYVWQLNSGSGFSNLSNSAPYSNVTSATMSITNITAGMDGYQYQCVVSGASPCSAATSSFATLNITSSGSPTIAASSPVTSAIACNAFNLSWTSGNGSNRLVVLSVAPVAGTPLDGTSYTANSSFGSGSTIAAGEYVVYKGTGNSVFINGLSASTTYYYKIFEYYGCSLGYLSSGSVPNGNATTSSCSNPAGATAVYVDACAGGCSYEGNNELIWGTSGSYALKVATNGPTLHYNSTTPPTTVQISTYGLYSSNITALNAGVTSCTNTVFVDPNTQGYIPANSKFLIAHSCLCSPVSYDFSGLCNAGPIYVVFGNDATWPCNNTGGIFGNKPSSGCGSPTARYFDLDFTAWGVPALDPIYSYSPCSLSSGADGDIVLFNPVGGAATTYSNSGCVVPIVVLPIQLVDFYATKNGKRNEVVWKVAQEENILYYIIEKSNDGFNFTDLTTVYANNEIHTKSYSIYDNDPHKDITYYRLSTKETNGTTKNYKIISLDETDHHWEYIHYQTENNMVLEFKNSLPKNSVISLYDINGKELINQSIKQSQTIINTDAFSQGVYFVRLSTPYKTEHFKIIISK